ncbi:hypothetical protein SAMN05421854_11064 [Amycolatopsis rubida]|uniref:Uncharacterized protein n=2 Tax=Amycolatopsis rubida TaxID=112413 RepID=A0A1I5X6N2_9PSEU|nr:hypothetical protein SAMN05421854_11064 [Amycolatopsis rubida]
MTPHDQNLAGGLDQRPRKRRIRRIALIAAAAATSALAAGCHDSPAPGTTRSCQGSLAPSCLKQLGQDEIRAAPASEVVNVGSVYLVSDVDVLTPAGAS